MHNIAFKRFKNTEQGKAIRDMNTPIKVELERKGDRRLLKDSERRSQEKSNRPGVLPTVYPMPPELIVEYASCVLFPEGSHREEDGWEILPEDEFQVELAKNDEHLQEHMAAKASIVVAINQTLQDAKIKEVVAEREVTREFEEFKRWKDSKRLLSSDSNGKK